LAQGGVSWKNIRKTGCR